MNIFNHLNRFPRVWGNLVLTVIAGFLQGLGLAFFVPVISLMNPESSGNNSRLFEVIEKILNFVGLPYNQNVLLIMVAGLIGASLTLTFCQQCLMYHSKMTFVSERRERMIENFLGASWPYIAGQSSGETINKLLAESFRAAGGLVQLVMAATELIMIGVFLAFGVAMSWQLLLISLAIGGIGFVLLKPIRRHALAAGKNQVTHERAYIFKAVDYLSGAKLIKAVGAQQQALQLINGLQRNLRDTIMTKNINISATDLISQMIPVFALTGIIYIGTTRLNLETGTLFVFVIFLIRMAPLMSRFQQRYQSYLLERPTIDTLEETIETFTRNREAGLASGINFDALKNKITFKHVSYSFPSSKGPTIKNISFDVPKGSMIAFVGTSGGGKSTILELLTGLRRPNEGRIIIDGNDLNDLNMTTWRKRIGYVGQDNIVFNDTLKNNLIFAHPQADAKAIATALERSHLEGVIADLPDGMETILGESGIRLSGGQRQRLALARALIGIPDLLILDEATSALDADSEQMIQTAIDEIRQSISVVVVAHRLSTIRNADVIHVVEHGKIVESGTYTELLNTGGRLGELHEMQQGK